MKSLKHNGIYVAPKYKAVGYTIIVNSRSIQLNDKQEEMAFAWCRKLGTPYVEDPVFRKNFFKDFCKELGIEYIENINFDQIIFQIEKERTRKERMTKEEKKKLAAERKKVREERKAKFGIAIVDGKEVPIANYAAEPSSIFMGRGKHPKRGCWKEGPRESDIVLNLSPDAPRPLGNWKEIVWKPKKMWIASWKDKLSGKIKYVWLSDTWGKKQEREKAKFDKAVKLSKNLKKVEAHINKGMLSSDKERMMVATACYLISKLNFRVGDEKSKDEADTVGCLTLRSEHISFHGNTIRFDFLGKDSVPWSRELIASPQVSKNIKRLMKKERPLFDGLTSKNVTKFLSEIQEGLTAKVFRTYRATKACKDYLEEVTKIEAPEKVRRFIIKLGILQAAKVCNHKKALSKNYQLRLEKKENKLKKLILKQEAILRGEKKGNLEKVKNQITIAEFDLDFYKKSSTWNLNTSLKSYIDPRVVRTFCDKLEVPYDKIYSKALLKKFSWALE